MPCGRDAEKPASGLMACRIAVIGDFHPGDVVADGPDAIALILERETIMARLVFPQALGKAAPI